MSSSSNDFHFNGDSAKLKGFLAYVGLAIALRPEYFTNDPLKVAYTITLLRDEAMDWAADLMNENNPVLDDFNAFIELMKDRFSDVDAVFNCNQALMHIKQKAYGKVTDYNNEFRRLSEKTDWNEFALMDVYIEGLLPRLQERVISLFPPPAKLSELMRITNRIDHQMTRFATINNYNSRNNSNNNNNSRNNRKYFRFNSSNNRNANSNSFFKSNNDSNYSHLSPEERARRIKEGLCLYCGQSGHKLINCPKRANKPGSSHMARSNSSKKFNKDCIIKCSFNYKNKWIKAKALIDSGSDLNLMDSNFAKINNFKLVHDNLEADNITGIGGGKDVVGKTIPILFKVSNLQVLTEFFVIDLNDKFECLIGSRFLKENKSSIDFNNNILSFCNSNNNASDSSFVESVPSTSVNSTSLSLTSNTSDSISSKPAYSSSCTPNNSLFDNSSISPSVLKNSIASSPNMDTPNKTLPAIYLEFSDVFSEEEAKILPPHSSFDCAIDLKPNTKLYYSAIYPLTIPEEIALEKIIKDYLKYGFIVRSKSEAGHPILFAPKDNGELRMCIDLRKLNEITIRDSYPMPLTTVIFNKAPGHKYYSKLDLKSAYFQIRIRSGDEYKTAFVCSLGHFEFRVMPFGFKNAPACFQRMIDTALSDYLGKFCYAYIDDIIIFSDDLSEHHLHVKKVLLQLRKFHLHVNLEKYEFN